MQLILRPWKDASAWAARRSREGRWKKVRGLNLEAVRGWLDGAPATAAWLAGRLGKAVPGARLADDWFDRTWLPSTRLPLGPDAVLAGRGQTAAALLSCLAARRSAVTVAGDLGADEFRAFLAAAPTAPTGSSELAGRRRSRVNLLRGRVTVAETLIEISGHVTLGPPKTRNGRRTVPLPRSVVNELEQHLTIYAANQNDSFIFTAPEGGALRRGLFRTRVWLPAVKAADLEGLRFHDLRHTFVALWVDVGVDPKEVSVRAGHSSVAFTLDRYGHLFEDDEDTMSERLDAVLREARRARRRRAQ